MPGMCHANSERLQFTQPRRKQAPISDIPKTTMKTDVACFQKTQSNPGKH